MTVFFDPMNFPNLITLSRIPLMLAIIGLLYFPVEEAPAYSRLAAMILFLFAAFTDWLDGWLARRMGQVSDFGKFMDALADKVLTLGMFVSLLALGELERWGLFPILLILSRELLITGLRLVAACKGITIAAEKAGKIKTVIQLACICLYLGEMALRDDLSAQIPGNILRSLSDAVSASADATLLLATLITVLSGVSYLLKYWKLFVDESPA